MINQNISKGGVISFRAGEGGILDINVERPYPVVLQYNITNINNTRATLLYSISKNGELNYTLSRNNQIVKVGVEVAIIGGELNQLELTNLLPGTLHTLTAFANDGSGGVNSPTSTVSFTTTGTIDTGGEVRIHSEQYSEQYA